ncbi:MAG: Asp-tRNA(Asn)/Glu-tRNA(Gln) amidotransferase subunit GatB, partial [Fulvivirga sp.]|nr:Asp-tRNA(Asn)/Glu-tRNA(Gln) amidotransferase subunit GatB [Fulvivirga sp.]
LEICDGNMEEGSLRCDANVSIMPRNAQNLGKKVEVKNMNSMKNVQRAIAHEIERQILALEAGEAIKSETRTFDAASGTTSAMRTKEELNDYRYFPDPDLSPVHVNEGWLEEIRKTMPLLPRELSEKFINTYNIPAYDAQVLTDSKEYATYFEALCKKTSNYKAASNWMMGPVKSYLNETSSTIRDFSITTDRLAELIELVDSNKVSFSVASQRLFPEMLKNNSKSAAEIAEKLNLLQESDSNVIDALIDEVLAENPSKVAEYKQGKKGIIGMFMGQLMKKSKGKADPKLANQLFKEKLD